MSCFLSHRFCLKHFILAPTFLWSPWGSESIPITQNRQRAWLKNDDRRMFLKCTKPGACFMQIYCTATLVIEWGSQWGVSKTSVKASSERNIEPIPIYVNQQIFCRYIISKRKTWLHIYKGNSRCWFWYSVHVWKAYSWLLELLMINSEPTESCEKHHVY